MIVFVSVSLITLKQLRVSCNAMNADAFNKTYKANQLGQMKRGFVEYDQPEHSLYCNFLEKKSFVILFC